jgi:AraC-like DNA-binding protein
MLKDYTNLMLFLTAFQSLFFFVFLMTHKKGKLLSNRILAAYLLILFLMLFNSLVFYFDLYLQFPFLAYQGTKFIYLSGPVLYFYTKSLTDDKFKFKRLDLLHLVPFFLFTIFMFFVFDFKSAEEKIRLFTTTDTIVHPTVSYLLLIAYYIQIFIYVVLSLNLLGKYRKKIQQIYSSTEQINLSWLRFVLFGFIIIWIFDISMLLIKEMYPEAGKYHNYVAAISRTYTFFYIMIFVFKGLKQPQIFQEPDETTEPAKYINSPLTEELKNSYLDKLNTYMNLEKPFLNPSISINQIAQKLDISSKYLSQIINEKLNKNFFDFINSYRIEEAKKMLTENNGERLTILTILYDTGFNSKSSFNAAFKKHTHLTPSQFKKQFNNPSIH